MPNFTYMPGREDPETTQTLGYLFTAGDWTPVPDDHASTVARLRANRFFAEQEGAGSGPRVTGSDADPLSQAEQSAAETGAELHDSGGADGKMPIGDLIPKRQRPNNGVAIEITPLQCRAARAGLEWSREHLAGLARSGSAPLPISNATPATCSAASARRSAKPLKPLASHSTAALAFGLPSLPPLLKPRTAKRQTLRTAPEPR
ncbi:MAG: hypothetical protein QOC72_2021 [Methylobacteriaceae bacterium]|nr:hypothetical protein [Methylobacteriaceae bacterium]